MSDMPDSTAALEEIRVFVSVEEVDRPKAEPMTVIASVEAKEEYRSDIVSLSSIEDETLTPITEVEEPLDRESDEAFREASTLNTTHHFRHA